MRRLETFLAGLFADSPIASAAVALALTAGAYAVAMVLAGAW